MVVEDELLIRMALADNLTDAGFNVVEAYDADMAIGLLQHIHVDLLLTDISMPGSMNGVGLAVFARSVWPHLKVIVVSGHVLESPNEPAIDVFLSKPYSPEAILASIAAVLC